MPTTNFTPENDPMDLFEKILVSVAIVLVCGVIIYKVFIN